MNLQYTPLLRIQREIQGLPRNYERFQQYLRTILNAEGTDIDLVPMLAMNPMGKDHVTARLDELIEIDADGIGARTAEAVSKELGGVPGDFPAALVVVDDLFGGWTNRWSYEFNQRKPSPGQKHFWVSGYLWASEPVGVERIKQLIATAIYRTAYVQEHGVAQKLRDLLRQEGEVLSRAGCLTPRLDPDDLEYSRQVIESHLDADDMRTCIECLFGDDAGRTLGFIPRGLSPWAGIALALHDAQTPSRSKASGSL
jgi:hypothetical protein